MTLRTLRLALFGLLCTSAPALGQAVTLVSSPPIRVNPITGSGDVRLEISNPGATDITLSLRAAPGEAWPRGAEVAVGSFDVRPLSLKLGAKETGEAVVAVRGVAIEGDYPLVLRNGTTPIGTIRVIRSALGVTIEAPPTDRPVHLINGQISRLVVRNADPFRYTVSWAWHAPGKPICSGSMGLPAGGAARVECAPDLAVDTAMVDQVLRRPVVDSTLDLAIRAAGGGGDELVKTQVIKATLNVLPDGAREPLSYLALVVLLGAGGLASLYFNQTLPNRLQRIDLQEQIDAMGVETTNLSGRLDTQLLVLVRLERRRLLDQLRARDVRSPDFTANLTQCAAGLAALKARVAVLRGMDGVAARLAALLSQPVPPSLVDAVDEPLRKAAALVTSQQPSETELQEARTAVADASARVETLLQPGAAFITALTAEISAVTTLVTPMVPNPTWGGVYAQLRGPWNLLVAQTGVPIQPHQAVDLNYALFAVRMMREYVLLYDGTADPQVRARLTTHEPRLLALLGRSSYEALRSARLLLREMKEDTYPHPNLLQALQSTLNPPRIEFQPSVVYERAPIEFSIDLNDRGLNSGTAREAWTCEWAFGDGLEGEGWVSTHYFWLDQPVRGPWTRMSRSARHMLAMAGVGTDPMPDERDFTVTATFRDDGSQRVVDANGAPITTTRTVRVKRSIQGHLHDNRLRAERMKLIAALVVAVFGLVAGARTEIAKLDLLPGIVAVFLVGFTADTVKNLLTRK